jgi:hypothetical protein
MDEESNGREVPESAEHIIVAVKDAGELSSAQGTIIDDRGRATRLVESLVEHGVEAEAVSALEAHEVPFKVSYRWQVELVDASEPVNESSKRSESLPRLSDLLRVAFPARPFELRLDRLIWTGLWVASLFVLGVSLVASMSSGAAREVVIEFPEQFQGSSQSQVPVESPLNQSPSEQSPVVGGAAALPECIQGGIDDCQCADFKTQPEAQQFYEAHPPGPGHIVDPEGNGVMCEWLPKG